MCQVQEATAVTSDATSGISVIACAAEMSYDARETISIAFSAGINQATIEVKCTYSGEATNEDTIESTNIVSIEEKNSSYK